MPIYTRTGDTGSTSLFGGKRVLKCEELVDVYGSIDELNSWIGLVIARFENPKDPAIIFLKTIQGDLFTIGSVFAGWKGDLTFIGTRVNEMESLIDLWEKELPQLTNFILPGSVPLAALVHIARSICRRVERQTVALAQKPASPAGRQPIDPSIIKYLNRLSDLFFMLARFINKQANVPEALWSGKVKHK